MFYCKFLFNENYLWKSIKSDDKYKNKANIEERLQQLRAPCRSLSCQLAVRRKLQFSGRLEKERNKLTIVLICCLFETSGGVPLPQVLLTEVHSMASAKMKYCSNAFFQIAL